jgi:hypothetical protein
MLVQPLGKAYIWTYVLYRDGHMVSRYASCPEWIPEGLLGDPEFEEYEAVHGREKALSDYMRTWAGDPHLVGRLFGVPVPEFASYLRQFTLAELAEWGDMRKRYADHKVRADDRYSIASPWVLTHFIERLGFRAFRDTYWNPEADQDRSTAPPVYTPSSYTRAPGGDPPPRCADFPFPFGGFFWGHDEVCGG